MNVPNRTKYNHHDQSGAALMIAMIMIFMLSIMGISSMRGSSLERRMASNSVQSAATFQSAESLTDIALNTSANLEMAWKEQPTAYKIPNIDLKNSFAASQGIEAEYLGDSTPLGFSIGVNTGGGFTAFNYEVRGGSKMEESRTSSAVFQGAYRVVPGF